MDHYDYIAQRYALNVVPREAAEQIRGRYTRELLREPPIGGWNTRDALDNMPASDAVELENWFPDLGFMKSRGGSFKWCDLDPGGDTSNGVETLLSYYSGSSEKLIACCDNQFYEVNQQDGPVALTAYETDKATPRTITRSRWQGTNFNGLLILTCGINGEEPLIYDASSDPKLYTPDISGSDGGVSFSPGTCVGCHTFKNRVYYWSVSSQDFWYTALGAPAGTLSRFPLSRVTTLGGSLLSMNTWTHDGGAGPDDFAVFGLSSGQCVVYQGTSPSSVGNWSIVGVYDTGIPVGVRCMTKYGGDLIVMTSLDWVKMTEVIKGFEARQTRTKISGAAQSAVVAHKGNFGWQALTHPAGKKVIFNIPTSDTTSEQHVMNIVTGAWCKFTGWNANCFASYQDGLYYGGKDGVVYRCDYGESDYKVDPSTRVASEVPINVNAISAFDRMDAHPNKNFMAMDITYRCEGEVQKSIGFVTDYNKFESVLYPDAIDRYGILWTSNYTWTGCYVGYPTFTGSGLNDMLAGTTYANDTASTYTIEIDTAGDTFKWTKTGFNPITNVSITGDWQTLNDVGQSISDNVEIMFAYTSGHTQGDKWVLNITEVDLSWAQPEIIISGWDFIYGYGRVFAYKLRMSLKQTVEWLSNHFLYNIGDRL